VVAVAVVLRHRNRSPAADAERKWRLALPMSIFKDLRTLYNNAGVTIYAVKDVHQATDDDLDLHVQSGPDNSAPAT